jgi:ribosomal protein L23
MAGGTMTGVVFRPVLTEYSVYIELLQDKLNAESLVKMSKTDVVKILIEQAIERNFPDVEIKRVRNIYRTLPF